MPRGKLAVLLAWALTVLDAAVPAYAVGGLGELPDAGGKEPSSVALAVPGDTAT